RSCYAERWSRTASPTARDDVTFGGSSSGSSISARNARTGTDASWGSRSQSATRIPRLSETGGSRDGCRARTVRGSCGRGRRTGTTSGEWRARRSEIRFRDTDHIFSVDVSTAIGIMGTIAGCPAPMRRGIGAEEKTMPYPIHNLIETLPRGVTLEHCTITTWAELTAKHDVVVQVAERSIRPAEP